MENYDQFLEEQERLGEEARANKANLPEGFEYSEPETIEEVEQNDNVEIEDTTEKKKNTVYVYSLKTLPDYSKINADYIKKLRRKLNLSEKNLADLLGVLPDTVITWESGIKVPKAPTLRLLYLLNQHPELTRELYELQR